MMGPRLGEGGGEGRWRDGGGFGSMKLECAGSVACMVNAEIQAVVAVMRQNTRWAATRFSEDDSADDPLLLSFKLLRKEIFSWQDWNQVSPPRYLIAFLEVIRSPETSAPITSVALSAVYKILSIEIFDANSLDAAGAMHLIVDAVTGCRFEVTDPASEEVVLIKILQVLLSCLKCRAGALITERDVCNVINTCFRVVHQSVTKGELLQRMSCHIMQEMIRAIFGRLAYLPEVDGRGISGGSAKGSVSFGRGGERERMARRVDGAAVYRVKKGTRNVESGPGGGGVASERGEEGGGARGEENGTVSHGDGGAGGAVGESFGVAGRKEGGAAGGGPAAAAAAAAGGGGGEGGVGGGGFVWSGGDTPVGAEPSAEGGDGVGGGDGGSERVEEQSSGKMEVPPPYGVSCLVEVFQFLCSLVSLNDGELRTLGPPGSQMAALHDPEDMSLFGLALINSALEVGGSNFARHPRLLALVQDELFRNLMQMGLSQNLSLLSLVCGIILSLYRHLRRHLKLQLEAAFEFVLIPLAQGKLCSYEQQEVAIEALVDLCRQPTFMPDLYANMDCDIMCENTFEDLSNLLSKNAFPVNSPLSAVNVLSLEGLLAVVHAIARRTAMAAGADSNGGPLDASYLSSIYSTSSSSSVSSLSRVALAGAPECAVSASLSTVSSPTRTGGSKGGRGGGDGGEVKEYTQFWKDRCADCEDAGVWVEFLRRQKFIKRRLMIGADHFNRDPKKGLEFLQGQRLLPAELDPKSVACFFRYTPGLDKNLLGEYFGDRDDFNIKVLHAYVSEFDFTDMSLDTALRTFLESFRLPGEAQKIERIMEAFAGRFFEHCQGVFEHKDAAFVLSYSAIILNTDLHNGQVRRKMTEEEFIRNNKSINNGKDLPRELLVDLYHSIARNELRITDSGVVASEMTYSRWVDLIRRSKVVALFVPCEDLPLLDLDMFGIMWGPAIAAISVVFDHAEEEDVLNECRDGFLAVAKISAYYCMKDVIDNLAVSLCKFTTLLNPGAERPAFAFVEDSKAKMAAETVFFIANNYGDHIRTGWRNLVDCIVRLHRLRLLPRFFLESEETAGAPGGVSSPPSSSSVQAPPQQAAAGSSPSSPVLRPSSAVVAVLLPDSSGVVGTAPAPSSESGAAGGGAGGGANHRTRWSMSSGGSSGASSSLGVLPPARGRSGSSGLMGRFSQLWSLETDSPTQDQIAAYQFMARAMETCRVEEIFTRSRSLAPESLVQLAKALVAAGPRPQKPAIGGGGGGGGGALALQEEEETAVLCLDLLMQVTFCNRDRVLLIWSVVRDHLDKIMATSLTPGPLVEKAVFELLRTGLRLMSLSEEVAEELLRSLQLILRLDAKVADSLCERIASDILQLLKVNFHHIRSPMGWRTVCSLLAKTARHPDAAETGFDALTFIMSDSSHITQANFLACLETGLAFAEARVGGVDRSMRALTLVGGLVGNLTRWATALGDGGSGGLGGTMGGGGAGYGGGGAGLGADDAAYIQEAGRKELLDFWTRLVRGVRLVCIEPREDVRDHALLCLQRSLLAADAIVPMPVLCGPAFDQVVFPVLDELLDIAQGQSPKEYRGMEATLRKAMALLSRIFLHFLHHLAGSPGFQPLWLAVLERMERYMRLATSQGRRGGLLYEQLAENIPELLKNMLLVMHSRQVLLPVVAGGGGGGGTGIESGDGGSGITQQSQMSMWDLTWQHVSLIAPNFSPETVLGVQVRVQG
ncbi:hypothetical protein CBR_g19322 [Chara braunii]|uniref:SEC7 domain-containing protein n=1 Tax=Chara braunii TaxID=69332 RepID=A0A388KXP4_CHABU|nr:hypothetical protein CBR_g19322 [Chara braunii]|eukprot:GBG74811.1 hypothetical protein CBR_g19322 [Chara braunii]